MCVPCGYIGDIQHRTVRSETHHNSPAELIFKTVFTGAAGGSSSSGGHKIVNGRSIGIEDSPWQAALSDLAGNVFCGGSLVNSDWVLTAHHCMQG